MSWKRRYNETLVFVLLLVLVIGCKTNDNKNEGDSEMRSSSIASPDKTIGIRAQDAQMHDTIDYYKLTPNENVKQEYGARGGYVYSFYNDKGELINKIDPSQRNPYYKLLKIKDQKRAKFESSAVIDQKHMASFIYSSKGSQMSNNLTPVIASVSGEITHAYLTKSKNNLVLTYSLLGYNRFGQLLGIKSILELYDANGRMIHATNPTGDIESYFTLSNETGSKQYFLSGGVLSEDGNFIDQLSINEYDVASQNTLRLFDFDNNMYINSMRFCEDQYLVFDKNSFGYDDYFVVYDTKNRLTYEMLMSDPDNPPVEVKMGEIIFFKGNKKPLSEFVKR